MWEKNNAFCPWLLLREKGETNLSFFFLFYDWCFITTTSHAKLNSGINFHIKWLEMQTATVRLLFSYRFKWIKALVLLYRVRKITSLNVSSILSSAIFILNDQYTSHIYVTNREIILTFFNFFFLRIKGNHAASLMCYCYKYKKHKDEKILIKINGILFISFIMIINTCSSTFSRKA
jgi:hypothetical protein